MKYFIKLKVIPFTKEGFDKLLSQKAALLSERPEAVENLRKAREMGDLSENGYYKAARAKLSFIDGRLRHFERLIKQAKIVEKVKKDIIDIGCRVKIIANDKTVYKYTIVGGYESNPKEKTISYMSPLGNALMGRKENDFVQVYAPMGRMRYRILKISY